MNNTVLIFRYRRLIGEAEFLKILFILICMKLNICWVQISDLKFCSLFASVYNINIICSRYRNIQKKTKQKNICINSPPYASATAGGHNVLKT